ncbi:MAG: preprotein translocase subunit Sec61beta [Ignisphaera sp.]|uniref:Preprotein translocase subunit Sec61beta n=1 Tax=Ignisphaera aggregans TaxID=334771 RepID=A0A7C4H8Q3_9CREN
MSRSGKKGRRAVGVSSYVGLVRFYEEVEEQIKIPPYVILLLAYITSITILALRILLR